MRRLFGYVDQPNFPPRYNVAPTQPVPIVRVAEGQRRFALVRWGLIPGWVKDPKSFSLLINARGESMADKPAFQSALRRRRCLFPADGFYEWKREGERRIPYFVRPRAEGPIAFAGLWELWTGPHGEEMESAVIITTRANRLLAPIHDRMPAIVELEAFEFWLDPTVEARAATAVVAPAREDLLEAYPVSQAVNRVTNDDPSLIVRAVPAAAPDPSPASVARARSEQRRRASSKPDEGQGSLF